MLESESSQQASAQADLGKSSELGEVAAAWGVETTYWDAFGKQHEATPELETAILASLGVEAATHESRQHASEQRAWELWSRPLPATLVLTGRTHSHEITISIPEAQAAVRISLEIVLESGEQARIEANLDTVPITEEATLRGQRFIRKRVALPGDLPIGYHELVIRCGEQLSGNTRLIVCPSKTYQPPWLDSSKTAGIAISLFGVRSHRNWGCGDTTDLKAIVEWGASEAGVDFIALNPLHAIANREPYNTSPYLPNSIFYRNAIYLDIEQVDDFKRSPKAVALARSPKIRKELRELRASEFVQYEHVSRLKFRFLKLLFRTFLAEWQAGTPRARPLRDYIEREGDLLDRFAVHSALDESLHKQHPDIWNYPDWPAEYQDPESAATAEFARRHWRRVLFYKYVQWQLDLQLESVQKYARERGLKIGLYHDLALAVDKFGADLWAHRAFFVSGCRVGAPPDLFSPKGQDWGFPPPNSDRHFQDGYRLFSETIRKNCRHGGALRIDHVMRFFHLYWIPDSMDATAGTYVRDRYNDLLGILSLESVRQQVLVIGEDLGTVADEIREALQRFGILSYRLLYFEQDRERRFLPAQSYPRNALVSATTHDLPTLAGFWLGRDIEARHTARLLPDDATYHKMLAERGAQRQSMLDLLFAQNLLPDWFPRHQHEVPELTGELHNAIVGFLASTPSKLLVLNQEDLLKETEQQNLPGSTAQYPNWKRKMKCTVEELWDSPEVRAFTLMFRSWLERTGRTQ